MKTIPLTKGREALIDDEDYERIASHRWIAGGYKGLYAVRYEAGKAILMHREIVGPSPAEQIDHKNGNPLDNRRENLRICTHAQNQQNKRRYKNCKSAYKGVRFDPESGRWRAQISLNRKVVHIGRFVHEAEAALAYDLKAKELFGEFAHLNFS